MTGAVPVPARGQPMKASWAAAVAERVNGLCAMAPSGMLARDGVGGMGAQPLPSNLRERMAAAGGRPMPFDLKGSVETSQDGTQKRLVVKWYFGGNPVSLVAASVAWNFWTLTPPSPTIDAFGWVTVYTGSWKSAENFSDYATIELWYSLQVTPSWQGGDTSFSVSGRWWILESSEHDLSDCELNPTGITQIVTSYITLGSVSGFGSGAKVFQSFHGNLHLHDLLCIGGSSGAGDGDAESARHGCWRFIESAGEGQVVTHTLEDCYYNVGGITKQTSNQTVPTGLGSVILCAAFSSGGYAGLRSYGNLGALNAAQATEDEYIVPLYQLDGDGKVALDMRNAPQIQVFEGTL
ncbi:MAG: hypothetical protein IJG13_02430 [Kiritimatiellae bacterium]|nr:hypothetical protein [Kiritimatiellia bacterium]